MTVRCQSGPHDWAMPELGDVSLRCMECGERISFAGIRGVRSSILKSRRAWRGEKEGRAFARALAAAETEWRKQAAICDRSQRKQIEDGVLIRKRYESKAEFSDRLISVVANRYSPPSDKREDMPLGAVSGVQTIRKIHNGIEIVIRMFERPNRYGQPEQYMDVRLTDRSSQKRERWFGTMARWEQTIARLVADIREA